MPGVVRARSDDTDADAERVQIALLRQAGAARRAQMALSLSATTIALARRAIGRRHSGASAEEVGVRFVEQHYGADLAKAVRQRLALGER
jgi:hypothetical protein